MRFSAKYYYVTYLIIFPTMGRKAAQKKEGTSQYLGSIERRGSKGTLIIFPLKGRGRRGRKADGLVCPPSNLGTA
jgi:hypothetical protein